MGTLPTNEVFVCWPLCGRFPAWSLLLLKFRCWPRSALGHHHESSLWRSAGAVV